VAMSHDGPGGGYVDERVGTFVAGGWCTARKRRRSVADGLFVRGTWSFLLSRQMHCCAFFIHSNLTCSYQRWYEVMNIKMIF
jgi:hypothetical protein